VLWQVLTTVGVLPERFFPDANSVVRRVWTLMQVSLFWVVLLQAAYGVRGVDRVMLETAQSYGMSKMRRFFHIQLPGSLPYIATGIRIAAIFALIVSIVAELVGGAPGLGNQILKAMSAGDSRTMYALILLTGVLGVLITATFSWLEKRVLFWHPAYRPETR
jgi:ABC-type nitrate/sulfonate/bicarbonate transport system permease component